MIGPADTRATGLRPGRPPNQIELDLERRSTRSIVVLGSGGHGRELADIVRDVQAHDAEVSLLGVVDDACPDLGVLARSGIRFLGDSSALEDRACELFIGVGAPAIRSQIAESFADPFGPLIHPTAIVGSGSRIGRGSVLAQRSIVTTNVVIGRHTHREPGGIHLTRLLSRRLRHHLSRGPDHRLRRHRRPGIHRRRSDRVAGSADL